MFWILNIKHICHMLCMMKYTDFFKHLHDSYLSPVCLSRGHLEDVFRPIGQRRLKQLKIFHGIQKSSKESTLYFSGHWKLLTEVLAYMCGALHMSYIWISGKGSMMWIGHLLVFHIRTYRANTVLALSRDKALNNCVLSESAPGIWLSGSAGPPWKRDGLKWNWVGGVKWKHSVETLHFSMLASQVSP